MTDMPSRATGESQEQSQVQTYSNELRRELTKDERVALICFFIAFWEVDTFAISLL
jgi:hypothetical protein